MSDYSFNAEIPKLMNMIIHNFYSSKDIFIRELISNASDAIDKLKYKSLSNPSYIESNTDFNIMIRSDKANNLLQIEDSGIGITKDDLINCLGTIAKSGTAEFVKNMTETKSDMIGQFGVGFYSAFLVADKVKVLTKHPESSKVLQWESDAISGYSITELEDSTLKRGTRIILSIKEDQTEFLDETRIAEVVKKHSGFTSHPIYLYKKSIVSKPKVKPETEPITEPSEQSEPKSEPETEPTLEPKLEPTSEPTSEQVEPSEPKTELSDDVVIDSDSDMEIDTETTEQPTEPPTEPPVEMEEVEEITYEKLNNESVWMKSPSDVKPEEYAELYKSLDNDTDTYHKVKHFKAEGNVEFSCVLFIPKTAPSDLFEQKAKQTNIKLYVKRVLITDNCVDLYPTYLNFIKGVVDCPDIPLNASRELLQQSKITKQINKILVKKTIELFNELAQDESEYETFYNNFSKNIKLAIHDDKTNKEKLMELLRFVSSKSELKQISLDTYIEQMKEKQPGIYYINADNLINAKTSPFVEKVMSNEYQVLFMIDPIDEYLMQNLKEYKDKKFINVINDDLQIETKTDDVTDKINKLLCMRIKETLSSKVQDVIISKKLVSQPAVVSNGMGISANMERILKAQALGNSNESMLSFMIGNRVLEVNPEHKIIKKLNDNNYDKEYIELIFEMGLLAGGYTIDNMNDFLTKVYNKL